MSRLEDLAPRPFLLCPYLLSQTMTILIMLFSSVVFGAKLAGLGAYKTVRVHKDSMEARFMCVFNVVIDPSDPEEVRPLMHRIPTRCCSGLAFVCSLAFLAVGRVPGFQTCVGRACLPAPVALRLKCVCVCMRACVRACVRACKCMCS